MKKLILIGMVGVLNGCAAFVPPATCTWQKPGAMESVDVIKYQCLQESQQRQSSAYINGYGGAAQNGVITNWPIFDACMNAHGFYCQ
jgi:hypothetical protein